MRLIRNWYKLLEGTSSVANDSGPGAATGAIQGHFSWLPYYYPPLSVLTFSGTLAPDPTGEFTDYGLYAGQPCFHNADKGYFLWWDDSAWLFTVSPALGDLLHPYWASADFYSADYAPFGGATGTGTNPTRTASSYKGIALGASEDRIVSAAAAGFPTAAGSIEMMVRPTWNYNDGHTHFFWDTYGGSNRRFFLYKNPDNTTCLYTDSTPRGSLTYQWTAGTLYHIVLNWGANQLYINNVLVKTFSAADLGLGASTLYIGDRYSISDDSFSGDILYFIVRDVALTLAEITEFNAFFQHLYISHIDT